MDRYSMDFTLIFSVSTDNPDPRAISKHVIVEALRERVTDLLRTDPENVVSEVWPPEIFDHETGTTTTP